MKKFNNYKYIIILIINILIIRSFIVEPFRIPSGSMIPTLLIGDFIITNKFIYGLKIPIINKTILKINEPEKGDIIIFKHKNKKKYIKRIIGMPGDTIEYTNKHFIINNIQIKEKKISNNIEFEQNAFIIESIDKKEFLSPKKEYKIKKYKNINHEYKYVKLTIPKDSYFVVGDNRDNSEDSRTWGLVNKKNIIGKAILIWVSFDTENKTLRTERIIKNIK